MRKFPPPQNERPSDLRDPLQQLLDEMRTNPDDAQTIAQFLDVGVLTRLFKEKNYGAEKKIRVLLDIIDSGTAAEKMKAIKMLDEIWGQALVRRGMLTGTGAPVLPGQMDPLGLPAPARRVESVEMTSKRVKMVLADPDEEKTPPPARQLPEPAHVPETIESDEETDTEFYTDNRDESCNIARAPTGEFGKPGR